MATRIIQAAHSNEFCEQLEKNGKYKQSQRRSGRVANVNEGDIVYIYITEVNIKDGDIRYKCSVINTNESIDSSLDIYATLKLEETYGKGTCSYSDLLENGLVKSTFFHWNIVPDLDEYIKGKRKNNKPKIDKEKPQGRQNPKASAQKSKASDKKPKASDKKPKASAQKLKTSAKKTKVKSKELEKEAAKKAEKKKKPKTVKKKAAKKKKK